MEITVAKKEKDMQIIRNLAEKGMTIYVLFMLAVFPLAVRDKYFDIRLFRYELYWKVTCAIAIFYALLGCLYLIAQKNRKVFSKENWKTISTHISKTDIFFTAFVLVMGISTLLAPYQYEAFWGNRGRGQGLFLWIWFYATYILITRFYHPKMWHLRFILLMSIIPCIWGIIGFFLIDPFNYFYNVEEEFRYIFASSFGNINTYSSYTGMMLAVSTVSFSLSKDKLTAGIAFASMSVVSLAHVMSVSDNTVLSTAAVFTILPFLAWHEDEGFIRSFMALFVFMLMMIVTGAIWQTGLWTMNRSGSSTLISIGTFTGFRICEIFLFLVILLFLYKKTKRGQLFSETQYGSWIKAFKFLLILGFVGIFLVLLYVNTGHELPVGYAIGKFLTFSDNWGTGRGLCWRLGMTYYIERMGWLQKLFGHGPDTYYIIMVDHYLDIMTKSPFDIFDSAHNEYLEYLLTTGALGLISYLAILVTAIRNGLSNNDVFFIAVSSAIFAYAIQAAVNIAIPIASPIFISYLSIASILKKV